MKTGSCYIRVSTDKQEELSPDAQKRLIKEYASTHEIQLPEEYIYIENGISGKSADKRPAFQKMISTAKLKPKPFDLILLWKFSRFARNQDESILYKNLLRNKCGIDIISISEPIADGMFGKLIERIIEWNDEFYSYNLSGEVTRGMTEKALRGGYQAGPPLGYRIDRPKEAPVIVPAQARLVELIFRKYVDEHQSFYDIARYLNQAGCRTSRGNPFEKRSVQYILQNPTYAGRVRWNRTENATNRIRSKDEWIVTAGRHPAIVSDELFEAAQKRSEEEYHAGRKRPSSAQKHWLSGLVKCSDCGRTLSACSRWDRKQNKRYLNFQCCGYLKGKCHASHQISETKISAVLLESIRSATDWECPEYLPARTEVKKEERGLWEKQLERLMRKELRMKEAYFDGIDTLEEYVRNKDFIRREQERLNGSLTKARQKEDADEAKGGIVPAGSLQTLIADDALASQDKNEALKSIIAQIVYRKEEALVEIHYYLTKQ